MDEGTPRRDRLEAWWIAARVHTLPAGAAPVIVGIGLAAADGVLAWAPALAALVGALLIQLGTNLANDYSDAIRGVDAPDRAGFTRVTAAGLLAPTTVRRAAFATYAAAVLVGTYLVYVGGLPVVVIGLSGILFGYLYTGGPRPYGYRGLGEVFVFVYFGLVAVAGTYYVQAVDVLAAPLPVGPPAGTVTAEAVVAGVAMGALTAAILVVNNLRDIDEDRAAGKRTLAVLLGARWTRVEYVGLLLVAYLVPGYFARVGLTGALAVYATLPLAAVLARRVWRPAGATALNRALTNTGRLTLAYAVLLAGGVLL